MNKEHQEERRKHKRYIVSGLRIKLLQKELFGLLSKQTSQEYPCLDISEDGLRFASRDKFNPNDEILLDISTPATKNKPIRVKAKIAWCIPSNDPSVGGVGIQFVSLDQKNHNLLKTLIERTGTDKSQITPYIRTKMMKEDSMFFRMKK